MGATAKATLCVLACAGAALLVWLRSVEGPEQAGGAEGAALAPRTEEVRAPELASVTVASKRLPEEPASGAGAPAARAVLPAGTAQPPGGADRYPAAPWPLLVRAAGAPAAGAAVTVQARLDAFGRYDAQPLEGVLDDAGEARFEIGEHLSELVAHAGGARPEELIVTIEDPDLVPAEASLILPDPLDPLRPPAQPLAVFVRLKSAAVVTGRLVDESGAPPGGEKIVQAHARRGGALDAESSGGTEASADGTFRLRVDGEGPHALCALAPGLRPATVRLALARGAVTEVGDVVLSHGLALDGRAAGVDGAPAAGANVFAALLEDCADVELYSFSLAHRHGLAWCGESFELTSAEARAGAEGEFRIDALGPGSYRIDSRATDVWAPFELAGQPEVEVPATVLLRPQAALLELVLALPARFAGEGQIAWTRGEEQTVAYVSAELAAGGVLRYALPPHEVFGLELSFGDLAPARIEVETPGVGEVLQREVALAAGALPARLVVVLRGEPVADGTPFTALLRQGERGSDRALEARAGELVLAELVPGPLRVTLTAGEDRFAPQEHLRDIELALELAPGEERRVEVRLERGGTLELEARTPAGERVDAQCTVQDSAGEALELVFVARLPNGRVAGSNHLFASGPARAVPELRPGRYRVRIEAQGCEPEELWLEVVAGTTTERSVVLRAAH